MRLIAPKIVLSCAFELLGVSRRDISIAEVHQLEINEDKIEGVCILLSTCGNQFKKKNDIPTIERLFSILNDLKSHPELPSRHRFMIMNLEDLKNSDWLNGMEETKSLK